ncbi:eukaryotic translation initiation factor 2-alpha kinase, partial [Coemansia sp. RSA 2703]
AEQLHAVFLDRVREALTRVFRMHAAVELSAPAVAPRTALLDTYQRPALYMDARGTVVQLANDHAVPFARYVARTRMTEIKRYCFDRVFAANAAGGQPVAHAAASFDAVTSRGAHAVAAAEAVSVACEVLDALPPFRRAAAVLLVNHMGVLDAVLAFCGVLHVEWLQPSGSAGSAGAAASNAGASFEDRERHAQFVRNVCFCLGSLYKDSAHAVRQRIQALGLTTGARLHAAALDRLHAFMDIRGDLATVQREVLGRIGSDCGMAGTPHAARGAAYVQAAVRAFQELRHVEATVRAFGVAIPLAYAPLFNHHYAYYAGAYAFQIMTEPSAAAAAVAGRARAPQVLAVGGRYDGLLRHFRHLAAATPQPADSPTGSARDVVCVGVQINVDLIIQEIARYQQRVVQAAAASSAPSFGLWTRKRCDVVVASFGARPMLRERIALARELWTAGLRTDFLFNDDPEMTMERLVEICRDQGMNWIVTIKRRPTSAAREHQKLQHMQQRQHPATAGASAAGKYVFKVKNILRRVECEVPRARLAEWLHMDIAEQLRVDVKLHEAKGAEPYALGRPLVGPAISALGSVASTPGSLSASSTHHASGNSNSGSSISIGNSSTLLAPQHSSGGTERSSATTVSGGGSSSRQETVLVNAQQT